MHKWFTYCNDIEVYVTNFTNCKDINTNISISKY